LHEEMYCHLIANAPVFQGTYGIFWYHAVSADEEALRWVSRLNRHYFIEGRTDMLSDQYGFKYSLRHIENPDFDDGTNGWTISPAEQGSIARKTLKRYNIIQGRYPYPLEGDNFLWMKRSARRPNRFSQEVKDLKPGKLYSVKLITADHKDLTEGRTNKEPHAVKITLDNVDVIPERSFQQPYKQTSGLPPSFKGNPAWLAYHYVLFRANGETAKLTISDWQSDEEPGGPIGQELMYNFIELQPYFEE